MHGRLASAGFRMAIWLRVYVGDQSLFMALASQATGIKISMLALVGFSSTKD